MKQKLILMVLFMFLLNSFSELSAQSLIIRLNNGSEYIEPLSTVQKLMFSSGELLVVFKSGSTGAYDLPTLQKIYFDASTSVYETTLANMHDMSIFPNPANKTINIQSIPDEAGWLNIYRSDGQLVLVEAVSSDEVTLDISNLTPGLYLLSINGHSSKFVKQ